MQRMQHKLKVHTTPVRTRPRKVQCRFGGSRRRFANGSQTMRSQSRSNPNMCRPRECGPKTIQTSEHASTTRQRGGNATNDTRRFEDGSKTVRRQCDDGSETLRRRSADSWLTVRRRTKTGRGRFEIESKTCWNGCQTYSRQFDVAPRRSNDAPAATWTSRLSESSFLGDTRVHGERSCLRRKATRAPTAETGRREDATQRRELARSQHEITPSRTEGSKPRRP